MKSYLTLLIITFINLSFYAQQDNSVVAQIGSYKITVKEFKLRFELSPYIPDDNYMYKDSVKYDFLYSWVAEKLWANEAERLGIDKTEKFNFYFKPIEELFVRDALFKKEVEDKVKLSVNDINSGIAKSQYNLNVQVVSTNDSLSIFNFYSQLKSSNNFDSLFNLNQQLNSKDLEVTLGSLLDEEIEDSLYSMDVNQFSHPILSEIGWVIFRIKNKVFTPVDLNDQSFIKNMNKTIKDRRIEIRYKEYRDELLSGTKIDINPESFKLAFNLIWDRMKNKKITEDIADSYALNESDYNTILLNNSTTNLNKALFTIKGMDVNIKSFLSQLSFDGFNVEKLDSLNILHKLSNRTKQFVEKQLITQEGYNEHLNLLPKVRDDLSDWREKYLAQFYFNIVLDSIKVSDSEVHNYYTNEFLNASSVKLVNIRLLTLTNLDEISNILDQIKNGQDFGDIVKHYGSTDTLVDINGETGLLPEILLGDIGKTALDLNLNEVYGPIQRNYAYTLMQVIEKKDSKDSLNISFEPLKNELRNTLRFKILSEHLKELTAHLAEKNSVKIFNNVVSQISTTNIPMFTHRLMGFGGQVAGMPLLTPFSGWIQNVEKKKIFP